MRIPFRFSSFILFFFLLAIVWGCAPVTTNNELSCPAPSLETPDAEHSLNEKKMSMEEESNLPEPGITVAEELKELEALGDWLAGTIENVPTKEEISYDFPVTMNKQVEYYLDFFQNRHSKSFTRWLERSGRYLPMIKKELRKAGLPEDLAYLPMIESGYNLTAYSHAQAAGPWQFINSTGRNYDLTIDKYVDERLDPVKSTEAAISFLGDLYDKFGDWQLAVAAYNAGGGKISRGMKLYNTENFWELAQKGYLQNETKLYVPKLIAAIIIAKNPEQYGFSDINYQDPLDFETIEVPRWTSLRAIEVACDASLDELQELNRELRQQITPPDHEGYLLKVPVGQKEIIEQNLPRVHATVSTDYKTHIVKKNDSLGKICDLYDLNKLTLLKANNLRKSKLTAGQRLRIPYQTTNYSLWEEGKPLPDNMKGDNALVLHTVKTGESLSHIAKHYNVPVHLVATWNDLSDINSIKAGQQLALYVSDTSEITHRVADGSIPMTAANNAARPSFYKVKSGDSIWTISQRFNLTPDQLKSWNKLKNNLIHPGILLRVSQPDDDGSLSLFIQGRHLA